MHLQLLDPCLQVKADKLREVKDGHDGTWVAHPALVTIALDIFNQHMKTPNQISKQRPDVKASEQALLAVSTSGLPCCTCQPSNAAFQLPLADFAGCIRS